MQMSELYELDNFQFIELIGKSVITTKIPFVFTEGILLNLYLCKKSLEELKNNRDKSEEKIEFACI